MTNFPVRFQAAANLRTWLKNPRSGKLPVNSQKSPKGLVRNFADLGGTSELWSAAQMTLAIWKLGPQSVRASDNPEPTNAQRESIRRV
jgi:hypothetical protein